MKKAVQFIVRYKIIHIIFWVYAFFSLYHDMEENFPHNPLRHYTNSGIVIFSEMLSLYFIIYYLIPKLLRKEKYFLFVLGIIVSLIAGAILEHLLDFITLDYLLGFKYQRSLIMTITVFIFGMLPALLGFIGVILFYDYYSRSEKNKQLEKERLETELNFLKSQINPHFLFNALNSIYVLMKEDIKLAEQTLLEFSSLLRYQLYDCNSNETILESEIEFLKNFVGLEKVRNDENRIVNFIIPERIPYFKIAPFILIPFVENAFKHISNFHDKVNRIDINIHISKSTLHFNVENTYDDNLLTEKNKLKGIGLQNVKRRLELLYPKKHVLEITRKENIYTINLTVELNGN